MSEFAALITGAVAGALTKASAQADPAGPFLIDVTVPRDSEGNYLKEVWVTGMESGEQLVVKIEQRFDTPESVAEKAIRARAVSDRLNEILQEGA